MSKIINVVWFGSSNPIIGMVAVETHGGKWKAYIGNGLGIDEAHDTLHIRDRGSKVMAHIACAAFPNLKPEDFTT